MKAQLHSLSELARRTGLLPADLEYIRSALAQEPTVQRAWLYGSRARGTHRRGSDVDLALDGIISDDALSRLRFELMERGPLPYLFDLTRLSDLSDAHPLRRQIEADGLRIA